MHDVPGDIVAMAVQCADAVEERAAVVVLAALGRHHRNPLLASGFEDRWRQNGMWTQLDEVGVSVLQHSADRRFEKNGGARVLPPICGAGLVSLQLFTGDRRIQRQRGSFRRQTLEGAEEVVFQRVHVVRVIGHFHGEIPVPDPGLIQLPGDVVEEVAVAGDGHRRRAVDRSHRDPPSELIERLPADRPQQRFDVQADGEHPALSARALLESASVVDHLDRLLEGEQTGQMVSGHFTGAVADYGIWIYPELRELLGQRDLYGEVGRLRDLRLSIREQVSSRRSSSMRDQSV